MQKQLDTAFRGFVVALGKRWFSLVSGGLAVPSAIIALYVSSWWQKISWGILAILGGVLASYSVWSQERRRVAETEEALERETSKNARPILRGNIEKVCLSLYSPEHSNGAEVFVKAVIFNDSNCQSTVRTYGLTVEDDGGSHTGEPLGDADEWMIRTGEVMQDSYGGVTETGVRETMTDLAAATGASPVTRGVHREGWLRFRINSVDPPTVAQGVYRLSAVDSFGESHELCSKVRPPIAEGELLRHLHG